MSEEKWTAVIKPKTGLFELNLKELWNYKDLIGLFVKRDFATLYKQTVLGPLWIVINPLLTTLIFTVVFGMIAGIGTGGIPTFIFYMAGNTIWLYFSTCLTKTSATFTSNAAIFGKVYFPRLVIPISVTISGLVTFIVQYVLFILFVAYYMIVGGTSIQPNIYILLTPILVLQIAMLAMGLGIIISSLTTKYRDLAVLVTFGVQLLMYASPVVYPMSQLAGDKLYNIAMLNPVAPILELFRYAYFGVGEVDIKYWAISLAVTIILMFIGILKFNKVEKTFMDTV